LVNACPALRVDPSVGPVSAAIPAYVAASKLMLMVMFRSNHCVVENVPRGPTITYCTPKLAGVEGAVAWMHNVPRPPGGVIDCRLAFAGQNAAPDDLRP
jgi:hypothetical protein